MLSRLSLIGLIILILGSVSLVLFTFLLPQLNIGLPLISGAGRSENKVTINSGNSEKVNLAEIGGHMLWVSVRVTFIIEGSTEYDCTVTLIYDSEDLRNQPISEDINYNEEPGRGYLQKTISTTIMPPASSKTYSLYLDIENDGNEEIKLGDRIVLVTYSLWATVLPVIIAIAGLVVTIVGVVQSRGPSVPKAKAAPGGWEPTLQWGGGAAKQPKMAIKSTSAKPKKVKKVVKKAAPAGGAQQPCKFCGKPVPASAFFCPHCYGKLR
jgi:hypothetical protein